MMKIGLRIPWECAKLPFADFAGWCKADGFDAIDLGGANAEMAKTIRDHGMMLGTVDLPGTSKLLSGDENTRKEGIEAGIAALHAIAEMGGTLAFLVLFPQDGNQSRKESFENWKASFPAVVKAAEEHNIRLALEGWPGPNNSALGVTPETLRAMFAEVPSAHFGLNYDASHLIRVGVDHKRFVDEFAARIHHAHGKDTALDPEGAYAYGNIGTTFAHAPAFGSGDWRYTIPGEGAADWQYITARLARAGFDGIISIELEDFRYNGTVDGEKRGLTRSRTFLTRYV